MTLVSPTQVQPDDEITDSSVNTPVNQLAGVINGNLDDTNISGFSGSKIAAGTTPADALDENANVETRMSESLGDFTASGGVWSTISGLNGTMTAAVNYIGGTRIETAAVASKTFTASRDTYVYIDSTGTVQYDPQTNGATQPATPTDNLLVAIVVTNGSEITNIFNARTIWSDRWTSWTPTFTSLSGGTLNYARYMRAGKIVFYKLKYTMAGANVSGLIRYTLPATAAVNSSSASSDVLSNNVEMVDSGTAYLGAAALYDANTHAIYALSNSPLRFASTSSSSPFTWGNGDYFLASGFYEGL